MAAEAKFDPSKLPAALRRVSPVVEDCSAVTQETRAMLAQAERFDEDQLSGPYGPKFVGFGPVPLPPVRDAFINAGLIAAIAGAVMLARAL